MKCAADRLGGLVSKETNSCVQETVHNDQEDDVAD